MTAPFFRIAAAPLVLASVLVACATAPEGDFSPSDTRDSRVDFGSYVAGRFADDTGDPRAADFLLRAARQDPENPTILSRAFLALITAGRMEETVSVARELRSRNAKNGLADLFLTLDALKNGRLDEAAILAKSLSSSGFETLIAPILSAWVGAAAENREAALAALRPLANVPALRPFEGAHRAFILDYLGDFDAARAAYEETLESGRISSLQPIIAYARLLQRTGEGEAAKDLLDRYLQIYTHNELLLETRERLLSGEPIHSVTATPEGAVGLILFRAANELEQDGAYQPAIAYARLAAFLTPEEDEANLRLGGLLADAELHSAALEVLGQVKRDSPHYRASRMQAAWVHQLAGDAEAAIGALRQYLERNGDDRQAWATLGSIFRVDARYLESADAYSHALALADDGDPSVWRLYFARGVAYERLGDWPSAEADLLKALEINPDDAATLNYLGYSWIDRGINLERGTELIKKAVELAPDDGFIIDSLGWAYYLRGDYEEAVRHLERAVLLEPSDPTINDHLGDAYWKVGRRTEARFQWSHALEAEPETEEARLLIAEKLEYGLELANAAEGR